MDELHGSSRKASFVLFAEDMFCFLSTFKEKEETNFNTQWLLWCLHAMFGIPADSNKDYLCEKNKEQEENLSIARLYE